MKKFLTNNLGLKILAVVISFVVWLVVVNYDDPVKTASFSNIPIKIKNADVLREKGKVFEVKNELSSIGVTITAKRTILDSLSAENILAEADVSNLSVMNTVPLQLSTNKNNSLIESIKTDTPVLELLVENLKEISIPITMDVLGEPADGYVVGDVTYATNTVRVSGPESVIDNIQSAMCSISVDERVSDISSSLDINLYDRNYEKVDHENVRKNISTINVSVAILPTKSVPVLYEASGIQADNYVLVGQPQGDIPEVLIAGRQKVLNDINYIRAGYKDVNIDGRTESVTARVDLANYLPDGVRLVTEPGESVIANVSVDIEEYQTKTFEVPFDSFDYQYFPEGYTAHIVDDKGKEDGYVKVKLSGLKSDLEALDLNQILGTVLLTDAIGDMKMRDDFEVTAAVAGTYLPEDISFVEAEKVKVRVRKED
ncbi:MAG: hypothetical protein K5686_12480 [Lachnospiraceae bacterium]|nr:hypothetical protein [Lachnospiraceae bacterium]